MSGHGIDLPVIGNDRMAGLLEPSGRLVWWCFARFLSIIAAVERGLLHEKPVRRYANSANFGPPEMAFLICRFWPTDALGSLGHRQQAGDLFEDALRHRDHYGLLSQDIHPQTGALWGNFPQTCSMAGLILTAMRLSRSWEDRYWRG
jgi:GH15 family glucan-1,4-alpha-glucosidase